MTTQPNLSGDITALAVAIGRIEEMLKSVDEKVSRLDSAQADHADILRKHTVEIELLKQRQGPRIHWTTWVLTVIGIATFVAAFVTYVVK